MFPIRSSLLLCAHCFLSLVALAQTEELLESIDPDLNEDESEQLEKIQWLQEHPFDLNEVTVESLRSIPGVTPAEAARVVDFRTRNGPFRSREQLLLIPDLRAEAAQWLHGFVVVRPGNSIERLRVDFRARSLQDIQLRDGYKGGVYAGSPNKSYGRLSGAVPGRGEAGVLVEKDAGEPTTAGFLSGYLSLEDFPVLNHVIIGDFRFETGQGLVFWQGGGFGKGGSPAETGAKRPRGLVPHRSTDEFRFLRGIGAATHLVLNQTNIVFAGFYSSRNLPATIDTSGVVSNFLETGMFRTESELSKRDGVREQLIGGDLLVTWRNGLSFGVAGYRYQLDHPIDPNSSVALDGRNGGVVGLNGRLEVGETEFVGEVAAGSRTPSSWVIRGIHRAGRSGSIVALYRSYSPGFPGLHSAGFGERSETRNEQGFYLGMTLRPGGGVVASLFVDNFSFPERTGSIPIPSQGYDVGMNLDVRLTANTDLSVRTTWSRSQVMAADLNRTDREVRFLTDHDQHRIRMTFIHEATRSLRLKTRIEWTRIPGLPGLADEKGVMLFQDIRVATIAGLSVEGRLVFFQTDSYSTRIYEFENDVRGVFSVPVLYGTGKRWYILAQYEFLSDAVVSFKFSETQKEGVRSLGSGPGEIEGDTENRITLQLDVLL